MAGVMSRHDLSAGIRDYFRKDNRRNQDNQREPDSNDSARTSQSQSTKTGDKPSKCDILGIVTDKPKYKQYCTWESRIASFVNWPDDKTQDKKDLAEAGFAYTGVDDSVRCFHCSIGLRDWPEGACPWEQHVLASPRCGHVIQCKGRRFIKNILGEEPSDSDVDDSDDVVDTLQLAMKRNEDAVRAARDFCTDEELLKAAVKATVKHDLHRKFTAVELVKAIDVLQERAEKHTESEGSSDLETEDENSESKEDLEEKNRKLKDPVTCKICFDAMACIVTLPCGHMVSCSQCVSALTKCAVCRAQIKGTVRALMAI